MDASLLLVMQLWCNFTNMDLQSKKISLVVLGITAIICSRMLFFIFHDAEGPNLLIVAGLAMAMFLLSYAAYVFIPSGIKGFKRTTVVVCIQVLAVIGLYFCMK
jgi:hypothetical protein